MAPAIGAGPIAYQWRLNGTNLAGATNALLELSNLRYADAGVYSLLASNALGVHDSSAFRLSVLPLVVTAHPLSQIAYLGNTARLEISAQGAGPIKYQWTFNGQILPEATNAILTLPHINYDQAGQYQVVVSNATGVITSSVANLNVRCLAAWGNSLVTSVPAELTNVAAIASGSDHCLALRTDGRVVAWGENISGETVVPADLSNVVAIAAGYNRSMALQADGTVFTWGLVKISPTNIVNGVAVAAGLWHNLVLKADGTVVALGRNSYGEMNVPKGLTEVVAIAAGNTFSMALKADGTVIAWGDNRHGQTNVPTGLSNVVAIAAGSALSLALKIDGTICAWGEYMDGETNVPPELTNVVAVAVETGECIALKHNGTLGGWPDGEWVGPAGLSHVVEIAIVYYHGLARTTLDPLSFASQPKSARVSVGHSVLLWAGVVGEGAPIQYQWYRNGLAVAGATNAVLRLEAVQGNTAGNYQVVAGDGEHSITSRVARVALNNWPPALQPQVGGNGLRLAWPVYPGLQLEAAADLTGAAWTTNLPGLLNQDEAGYSLEAPMTNRQHYFRLRQE